MRAGVSYLQNYLVEKFLGGKHTTHYDDFRVANLGLGRS